MAAHRRLLVGLSWLLLPGSAALATVVTVWNPMRLARVDGATALVAGATVTLVLAVGVVGWPHRAFDAAGIAVAVVAIVLVGCCCTGLTGEFGRKWTVLARSPDGRYALAEYAGPSLGPDGPHYLNLWAGSGRFARDSGRLLTFSHDHQEVHLTDVGFLDNRTIRAVVGSQEYVFDVAADGRPRRRS